MDKDSMIAPCGIDCSKCSIFIAANDPEAAKRLAEEWRAGIQKDAKPEWFKCQGCRGDRSLRWSPDCELEECCTVEKGLKLCSECDEFPCPLLREWAAQYDHHREGLDYLKTLRQASKK